MKNPQYFTRKSANFSLDQATEEGTPPEKFCFAYILFFNAVTITIIMPYMYFNESIETLTKEFHY